MKVEAKDDNGTWIFRWVFYITHVGDEEAHYPEHEDDVPNSDIRAAVKLILLAAAALHKELKRPAVVRHRECTPVMIPYLLLLNMLYSIARVQVSPIIC